MKLHIKLLLLLGLASSRGVVANEEQQPLPTTDEQTTVNTTEPLTIENIHVWNNQLENMTLADFIEMVTYINSKREEPLVIISKKDLTGCTFLKLKCGSCKKVSTSDLKAPVSHITQEDLKSTPETITSEDLTLSQTIPTDSTRQEETYTGQN